MCELRTTFIQVLTPSFIYKANAHWLFLTNRCTHVRAGYTCVHCNMNMATVLEVGRVQQHKKAIFRDSPIAT